MSKTQTDNQQRKSIAMLKEEHDSYRRLAQKPFVHTKTGETYQVLFTAFDEHTNEIRVVYVLSAMPWLKFVRPVEEFLAKFQPKETV